MQNENPPAFPRTGKQLGNDRFDEPGMTLRDYFAGQALGAIIAATSAGQHQPSRDEWGITDGMAFDAYELADAMLAARQKGQPNDR